MSGEATMNEDVTKDESVAAGNKIKRWMSEPTLLGDYDDDDWIKNTPELHRGVSFTDEVVQPNLTHVTKERVQLRPKRRPPSRDFIKSRASMDFEFAVPEQIKEEEEEDIAEQEEKVEKLQHIPPSTPSPRVKPKDNNAWRLPTIESDMVLRKTPSNESKGRNITKQDSNATTSSETSDESTDLTQSPEKKNKRRPKIKLKLFKYRRNRQKKETEETPQQAPKETRKDTNMNLRQCVSVDSGSRPLGEEQPKSWLHRRWRRKSHEKRSLNWLLGLFHKRDGAPESPGATSDTPLSSNHGNANSNNTRGITENKLNNELVSENKSNTDIINGAAAQEEERHDTVSDLKKKFETHEF